MELWLIIGCSLLMVVGIAGVVVPFLPGTSLCLAAVLLWALLADQSAYLRWIIFGICVAWFVVGAVLKYTWPGKRMQAAGVPAVSMLSGALLGVLGMFIIPVVGLFIGFVFGVWLAESYRQRGFTQAWPATWRALKAAGLSLLIELAAGLFIVATWSVGVLVGAFS